MQTSSLYPNLEPPLGYKELSSVEANIRIKNFLEAITEFLFLLQDPKTLPDFEKAFEHLFNLLPRMNREQFDILIKRLPSFLDVTASFAKQQNILIVELGQKFFEFNSPIEALKCYIKGIKIAESRKDRELTHELHVRTTDLFLTLINPFLIPNEQFRENLILARRKGHVDHFASLLEHIKILGRLFNRPDDKEKIDQKWLICRDVLHELGATGSFLPFVDLIATQRSLPQNTQLTLVTERYQSHLNHIRKDFSESLDSKSVRFFQRQISKKLNELCQGLISASISIIGPPPCDFDIRSIGSFSREEPTPFSDLEFFIIIENENHRSYFTSLLKIFEFQILLFGETADCTIVTTCLGDKNKSGFHLDVGANPLKVADLFGTPENMIALLNRPISDFDDVIGDSGTQIIRSQSLLNQSNTLSLQFENKLKAVLNSGPDQKLCHARALKLFKKRYEAFNSAWKVEKLSNHVNIKEQFTPFLTFFLSDLAIYLGVPETNTIDVIDALAAQDIFTGNTAYLLKEAVSFIYLLRIRMHLTYNEQNEDAYIKSLSGFILKTEEIEQLEKIYWLILKPLFSSCLSRVIIDKQSVETVFHQLDIVSSALELMNQPVTLPETYLPLIKHAAKHHIATKRPLHIHLEVMKSLSRRSDFELLRQAYAEEAKNGLSYDDYLKLLDIPNRAGIRLAFSHEQKMLHSLIKLATSKNKQSDVQILCSLGARFLTPQVISDILDDDGRIKKTYPSSAHNVTSSCGMHFKEKPTQPLMEYAIHNLLFRLTSGLTPATELVRFAVKGRAFPVLISKTTKGKTLKEQLPNELDNEQWIKWSWMLLASILMRPGDGRLSNFILNKGYISCIDNEISFVEPVVKGNLSSQIYFCSALFCLFQNKPLEQKVIEEFCELDSNLILEGWINDVIQKEKEYRKLFSATELSTLYNEDPLNKFKTTILFRQGALATLNMQFVYLQNQLKQLMRQGNSVTPIRLLEKLIVLTESPSISVMPGQTIAKSYSTASQASVERKLIAITSRKEDKSFTSMQSDQACLGKIPTFDEIYKLKLFTPSKAKEELYLSFLKNDDFFKTGAKDGKGFLQANFRGMQEENKPDIERQRQSLLSLIGLKGLYRELPISVTLQYCIALTSSTLAPFLHPGIEYLDLSFCPQIKNSDIRTIQNMCPKLKELRLTGCSGLTSIQGGRVISGFLEFRNLKIVYLNRCPNLKNIRIKSPCLHYINASHNPELHYVETNTFIFRSLEVNFDNCPKALDLNDYKGRFRQSYGNIHLNTCSIEYIKDLSAELCDDREFMVQAIDEDGPSILKFATERLRNDRNLILYAIDNSRYASTGRMSSSVIPSVQALEFASNHLKNDKEVVVCAIGKSAGTALQFASEELKNNRMVVKEALYAANEQFPYSYIEIGTIAPQIFKFISDNLKNDPKIIAIYKERKTKPREKFYTNQEEKRLATEDPFKHSPYKKPVEVGHLTHADETKKRDANYVLASIVQNPEEFQYAHGDLKGNIPFVQKVIDELPDLMDNKVEREPWNRLDDRMTREKVLFGNENFQCVAFLTSSSWDKEYFKNSTPILKYAHFNVKNDIGTAYCAVRSNLLCFELLTDEFKDYDKFMLKCIGICPEAFKFASHRLKKDKNFILKAIQRAKNGDLIIQEKNINYLYMMKSSLLAYADETILDDDEVVEAAIKWCGNEIQFASERIRNRQDIFVSLVVDFPHLLKFAGQKIKNDKSIVLEAVNRDFHALNYASEELRADLEFIQPIIAHKGEALEYVSDELKNNPTLVFVAVKQCGESIRFASENLRNHVLIVGHAVRQNGLALKYASKENQKKAPVVLSAVRQNGSSIQFADEELKNNIDIVLEAIQNKASALKFASDSMKNNQDVVLSAVNKDGLALEFASEELKNNENVVFTAVKGDGVALEFASKKLKNHYEIVLCAIKQEPSALQFASRNLKNNIYMVLEAVKRDGSALEFAGDNLKNNKICILAAVKNNFECVEFLGDTWKNDREIVIEALLNANIHDQGNYIFNLISEELKNDSEIISIYKEKKVRPIDTNSSSHSTDEEKESEELVKQPFGEKIDSFSFAYEISTGNADSILQAIKKAPLLLEIADKSDSDELEYQQWIADIDYWKGSEDLKARDSVFLMRDNLQLFCFIENTEYLKLPFKNSVSIFKFANSNVRCNEGVALESFFSHISCLEFADMSLRDSESFMLTCIHHCAEAFRFASDRLKRDKRFVLKAIEKASYGWLLIRTNQKSHEKKFIMRCSILAYIQEIFGDDEEVVFAAIKKFGSEINFASERIKKIGNLVFNANEHDDDNLLNLIRSNI